MQDKLITSRMRLQLKRPQGRLMKPAELKRYLRKDGKPLISVGDITTLFLLNHRIIPDVSFLDFKRKRRSITRKQKEKLLRFKAKIHEIRNPAGMITGALMQICKKLFSGKITGPIKVYVEGEEDLAVIPAEIYAPLGSIIVYGQPDEGIVMIRLDKTHRKQGERYYLKSKTS